MTSAHFSNPLNGALGKSDSGMAFSFFRELINIAEKINADPMPPNIDMVSLPIHIPNKRPNTGSNVKMIAVCAVFTCF